MKKSCSNCELYKKVKRESKLVKEYYCFPESIYGLNRDRIGSFSCSDWKSKIPKEFKELFGKLFDK